MSDSHAGASPAAAQRPFAEPLRQATEHRFADGNGQALHIVAPAPAHAAANGERRTLHLSLGNGSNGNGLHSNGDNRETRPSAPRPGPGLAQGFAPTRQSFVATPEQNAANGVAGLPPAQGAAAPRPAESSAYIDRSLRERVDTDIAAFLAAFDVALDRDTPETRAGLREATDRLLRAGARTRIELERLEARMPLPPRDRPREGNPAWPHR